MSPVLSGCVKRKKAPSTCGPKHSENIHGEYENQYPIS